MSNPISDLEEALSAILAEEIRKEMDRDIIRRFFGDGRAFTVVGHGCSYRSMGNGPEYLAFLAWIDSKPRENIRDSDLWHHWDFVSDSDAVLMRLTFPDYVIQSTS